MVDRNPTVILGLVGLGDRLFRSPEGDDGLDVTQSGIATIIFDDT